MKKKLYTMLLVSSLCVSGDIKTPIEFNYNTENILIMDGRTLGLSISFENNSSMLSFIKINGVNNSFYNSKIGVETLKSFVSDDDIYLYNCEVDSKGQIYCDMMNQDKVNYKDVISLYNKR